MNNLTKYSLAKLAVLPGMVLLGTGLAQATTIPPVISNATGPVTILTDSHLISNVRCTITTDSCIKFGARGIKLNLNGFTMTGNGQRASCTLSPLEIGIDTNLKNNVSIEGPGVLTRFQGLSILVNSDHSSVEGVAMTSDCIGAIRVRGSFDVVEGNSVARASVDGGSFGAIFISPPAGQPPSRHNRIINNEVGGGGAGPYPLASGQGGHGIFVGRPPEPGMPTNASTNNLIAGNTVSGNPGVGIVLNVGSTGNIVRLNQALGNVVSDDILDANPVGANTYDRNLCEVSRIGPSAVNICKVPDIAGHRNFEPAGDHGNPGGDQR